MSEESGEERRTEEPDLTTEAVEPFWFSELLVNSPGTLPTPSPPGHLEVQGRDAFCVGHLSHQLTERGIRRRLQSWLWGRPYCSRFFGSQ